MDKENMIIAIVAFILMIIFFYCRNMLKLNSQIKNKKKKSNDILEVKYLCLTNKIDKTRLMNKKMMFIFSLINAIIVDFVFLIVIIIRVPIFFKFLIGLVLFIGLIYSIYGIFGKILVKKGYDK